MAYLLGLSDCVRYYYTISTLSTDHSGERQRLPQELSGRSSSLADFGAFVDVGKGVEGLVHVSEMPVGKVTMEELAPGQEVGVRVLEIDHDQRHIALSMRGIAHQIGQSVPSSVWEGRSGESAAERGTEDA